MLRFLISRIVQSIAVVVAVLVITFGLMKAAPGSPLNRERASSPEARARQEKFYGLNEPWHVQLGIYLWNFATLTPIDSPTNKGHTVTEIIADGFPVSASIGLPALGLALLLGVPMGALAAVKPHSLEDRGTMTVATLGLCAPSLVLGPVMALVFGLKLKWFNVAGWFEHDDWVLPSMTLGLIYSAYIARLMRAGLRETLAQDFIRTARAKGAGEGAVVFRHALKLACLPLLNFLGPTAAGLLTGSFVVEMVFQIPGLGKHFVNAAVNRDYPLAMATAAFYAALICGFNLVVDFIQALLNPRIGFKG